MPVGPAGVTTGQMTAATRVAGPPPVEPPRGGRRRLWAILAAILVLLIVGGVAFALLTSGGDTKQVTVPDVAGQPVAQAQAALTAAKFDVQLLTVTNGDVAEGMAIGTEPAGGTTADEGSTVVLRVSGGPGESTVPDVTGKTEDQATTALTRAGFEVDTKTEASADVAKGLVISQDPAGAATAEKGSTVTITVSSGTDQVTVPNVSGQSAVERRAGDPQRGPRPQREHQPELRRHAGDGDLPGSRRGRQGRSRQHGQHRHRLRPGQRDRARRGRQHRERRPVQAGQRRLQGDQRHGRLQRAGRQRHRSEPGLGRVGGPGHDDRDHGQQRPLQHAVGARPATHADHPVTARVAVLMGGRSSEHDVSLASAAAVIAALDPDRYEVIPVLISANGVWSVAGESVAIVPGPDGDPQIVSLSGATAPRGLDVAFPVLHGPHGEDGTVQGLLETAGVPYVGAGVAASAVAMDKALFKVFLAQAGIPTPEHTVVTRAQWEAAPRDG